MFNGNDEAKGEYRPVEVRPRSLRRRRWSAEEKARIVEETLVPGAPLRGGTALAGLFTADIRMATYRLSGRKGRAREDDRVRGARLCSHRP
jgi:hypothetical protein